MSDDEPVEAAPPADDEVVAPADDAVDDAADEPAAAAEPEPEPAPEPEAEAEEEPQPEAEPEAEAEPEMDATAEADEAEADTAAEPEPEKEPEPEEALAREADEEAPDANTAAAAAAADDDEDDLKKPAAGKADVAVHVQDGAAVEPRAPAKAPLAVSKMIVRRPGTVCFLYFLIVFLVILTLVVSKVFHLNIDQRAWLVHSDPLTKNSNALFTAMTDLSKAESDALQPVRSKQQDFWTLSIYYSARGDNMLTVAALERMRQVEEHIKSELGFERFCLADPPTAPLTGATTGPGSGAAYEPPCSPNAFRSVLDEYAGLTTQAEIDDVTLRIANNGTQLLSYFVKEFGTDHLESKHLRSYLLLGAPLGDNGSGKQFKNDQDGAKDNLQFEKVMEWTTKVIEYADPETGAAPQDEFEILFAGFVAQQVQQTQTFEKDSAASVLALVVVYIIIGINTGSFFIANVALLGIVFAFPVGYFIQYFVFQVRYFDQLNTMILYVILGIAADDAFVFVDAWNQVLVENPHMQGQTDLLERMDLTYRRAATSMLVTSLTTAFAFFATAISPLTPISSFGYFSAAVVCVNYAAIITVFPAGLVIRERVKWLSGPCCCRGGKKKQGLVDGAEQEQQQYGAIERFFADTWHPFLAKTRKAFLLHPLRQQEVWMPDEHPMTRAQELSNNGFQRGDVDMNVPVTFIWGIAAWDAVDDPWEVVDLGEVEYVPGFSIASQQQQDYLDQACQTLKAHPRARPGGVRCFIDGFKDYLDSTGQAFPAVYSADPAEQEALFMANFTMGFMATPEARPYLLALDIGLTQQGRLNYVKFQVSSALTMFQAREVMLPHYRAWEATAGELRTGGQAIGMGSCMQTNVFSWAWMATEKSFVTSVEQGLSYCVVMTFGVLVLFTGNFIVSFFAVFCIGGILACEVAIMVLMGWELGVSESIAIVVLVGFSVDYVTHLAHAYVHSHAPTRSEKTRDALRGLGVSIVAGALTTFSSGCFLFLGTMLFFYKFAIVMTSTVLLASLWSLVFFCSVCMTIGPEGNTGNIWSLFQKKSAADDGH